jgi:hypothetical protein
MPSVMDAPELMEYVETHELTLNELTIEPPQPRRTHPGFWRTLMQYVTWPRIHRHQRMPSLGIVPRPPVEAPMDRLIREHPSLTAYAFSIV